MKSILALITIALTYLASNAVLAYEVVTHVRISREAARLSILSNDPSALDSLALDIDNIDQPFESERGLLSILDLIEFGAESEDDGIRPLTHFFDPISGGGIPGFASSPSWALEDDQSWGFPLPQNYSLLDAVESLYGLLTLPSPEPRFDRAAHFFESLGHIIHHVQDMAQPQHTRGDRHFRHGSPERTMPWENPSLYERWINRNIDRLPLITGYPIPDVSTARTFWMSADGIGIANYSNAGFVSTGTNFPESGGFPSPQIADAEVISVIDVRPLFNLVDLPPPAPCLDINQACVMLFLRTFVQDRIETQLSAFNSFTSTYSMFDDALERRGLAAEFSLNRFNFNSAKEFLIPRAVSYSAGFLNFVFRGKLSVEAAETADGKIVLEVINDSEVEFPFESGEFELRYDSASGRRNQIDGLHAEGKENATLDSSFSSGETLTLYANMPSDAKTDTRFLLTFRGNIGPEVGIASASFKVEPYRTGFAVSFHDGPTLGYVSRENNQWIFTPDPEVKAGNIDWRGAYVDGKPTKTLTWSGPTSRYFDGGRKMFTFNEVVGEWRASTFQPYVYENGRVFAIAPGPVLGAAVTRDSMGKEWLVIVTNEGPWRRVVYRRPNERSNSSDLYDPLSNPNGWMEIGRYAAPPDENWTEPRSPWFFNGDGTAAQTMETIVLEEAGFTPPRTVRIELQISGTDVTWINHGNLNENARWVNEISDCTENYTVDEDGNVIGSGSDDVVISGRTVLAVDYIDDKEVIATLEVEGSSDRDDFVNRREGIFDWSRQHSYREKLDTGTHTFTLSSTNVNAKGFDAGGGTWKVENHSEWVTYMIRFMDLRENVLQVAEYSLVSDLLRGDGIPSSYTIIESIRESIKIKDVDLVTIDGDTKESHPPPLGSGSGGPGLCGSERERELSPVTIYWPLHVLSTCPACVGEFALHNHYQVGLRGSMVIDEAGRLFSSQDIIGLPPTPTETINYLSDAPDNSPAAIIGIGTDDFTLYEPRLIR